MEFGGSDEIHGERFGTPTHFTLLWCAPEVLGKGPDIPWNLADLYSYGLVVASYGLVESAARLLAREKRLAIMMSHKAQVSSLAPYHWPRPG
ncbi:hypothetical protein BDV12DRAFT_170096 [Aspergillus spectabilis]